MPTIDTNPLSGHPRGLVREQEANDSSHVVDGAYTTERHLCQVVVEECSAGGDEAHELVVDDAGTHVER